LNQFAYKLEGFNDDWVDAGTRRSATYTNLAPGEYTFRVKAANSDGVWNEEGTTLTIIVEPPLWGTWWFRLLGLGLLGSLVFGVYRLRTRQLEDRARHLEAVVGRRTSELKESNYQLVQSQTIVEAINRETSFSRLLTKILEEARVIAGVEKATALVYSHEEDRFYVRASSGWDVEAMKGIRLTRREARDRYVRQAEEVADDIFVAKNVSEREGSREMAEFGQVASFLVLRVEVEGDTAGYLVFDNLTNPDAFDQRDVDLLVRLREHIQSAFIKTRILEDLQATLSDLQSTQDRLVQSEKMASLGQLTAGIAHEIRNPLNFVNNFSEVTQELVSDVAEEIRERRDELPADLAADLESVFESLEMNARKIGEHGRRAEGIVRNMLEHSKTGEGQRSSVDLNELLGEYVTLAEHSLKAQEVEVEIQVHRDFDDPVGRVDIVPQDMGRVFMNLITNAFDALREQGSDNPEPAVRVSTAMAEDSKSVEIRIADNGPGIPEKVRTKIFEPFFTTKPTGSGTGLGLSMSYDIVTKGHGGSLEVESEPGKGATFIVRLPA
jgi:signal transduction histidine kinase